MSETGALLSMTVAELLEAVASLRFHARQLVNNHAGDWDLTRAVDALDERVDALVTLATPDYRWHHPLTFKVKPIGRDHLVVVTSRVPDGKVVVVVDASGVATLGLVAPAPTRRSWSRCAAGPTASRPAPPDGREWPPRGDCPHVRRPAAGRGKERLPGSHITAFP